MPRIPSLRVRLFLLAGLVILPMLAQMIFAVGYEQQVAIAEVIQETRRLTQLIFGKQDEFTQGAQQFLSILAMLPEIRSSDPVVCSAFLAELAKQYPIYANIGVANLAGDVICSAISPSEPINILDRPYFQRVIQRQDFAIGDYQIGRITGVPSLNYGYPTLDSAGQIQAVVYVALDLTWLDRLVQNLQLPSGATFKIIDENGTVLARTPDSEQWVGRSIPGEALIQAALTQAPDSVVQLPGLDGIQRLYTFGRISAAPGGGEVIAIVGVPPEVAFAEANRYLLQSLVLIGLALIIAFVAAWVSSDLLILRKIQAILGAIQKMTAGDLSIRTGVSYEGELGLLARTFDEMAMELEKRDIQIRRHTDELEQLVAERTQELDQALQRERALNAMRTRFTSMVSHEFRSPLTVIYSSSQLLKTYSARLTEEKKLAHLDDIETQIKRLVDLLDDFLALSKAEAAVLEFKPVPLDLRAFCNDLANEIQAVTAAHQIIFSASGQCAGFIGDEKLLRQIITNLLTNAVKYSPEGSKVYFDLICEPEEAVIHVKDEGIGIPEDDQKHLFEVFHRAQNVGAISGTGLGLAIVKRAVEVHNGMISFESEIGHGTTFTVRLPLSVLE